MNHPHILNDDEFKALIRKDRFQFRLAGIGLAIWIAMAICISASCSDSNMSDEQKITAAFYPSKPSLAQQVTYQEEAREQLRLRQLIAHK